MKRNIGRFPVAQEHAMGCAVACVAFRCGISYLDALSFFPSKRFAWTRGYYCNEVVEALDKANLKYEFSRFAAAEHEKVLKQKGTIVFIDRCLAYPAGHYLIRDHGKWMNPWSSFPFMTPVKADLQTTLPGKVGYILYEVTGSEE